MARAHTCTRVPAPHRNNKKDIRWLLNAYCIPGIGASHAPFHLILPTAPYGRDHSVPIFQQTPRSHGKPESRPSTPPLRSHWAASISPRQFRAGKKSHRTLPGDVCSGVQPHYGTQGRETLEMHAPRRPTLLRAPRSSPVGKGVELEGNGDAAQRGPRRGPYPPECSEGCGSVQAAPQPGRP